MAKKGRRVTEYELAVLDVLWNCGPATIREITEAVYRKTSPTSYATVQKLLERLEKKGCVHRDRSQFAHRFRAKIARTELIGQGLEDLAQKLCGGSLTPLLVHLAETTRLSPRDRLMLRKLIDETK
jgi:BlaI family transcriptional regulator, penicillinase repressor